MRKLPTDYENPIDNIILQYADPIVSNLHAWGLSPNALTTIGNFFRVISIYFLVNGIQNNSNYERALFLATAFISYLFDCFDGHCARMFGEGSAFGDYYDHISDTVYHTILLYIVYKYGTNSGQSIAPRHWWSLLIFAVFLILTMVHLGCQETHCENSDSQSLTVLKRLCTDPAMIKWTRFFGSGTFVLVGYLLAYIA